MSRYLFTLLLLSIFLLSEAEIVIKIPAVKGDATQALRDAIQEASSYNDEEVVIELPADTLNISRAMSSPHLYHISNTTSVKENPDPTKHIGIWLKNIENLTIEGNGCSILTHGEMTSFVVDSCKNIHLRNFRLDSTDPSVVEITITDKGENYIEFEILPPTSFEIIGDSFSFVGDGWKFGENQRNSNHVEYAQLYYSNEDWTKRCVSPIKHYKTAWQTGERTIRMTFDIDKMPKVSPGERYQLRHGIRNEACMFINRSKDIELKDIEFNFMGNFGIVGQFSENLCYDNLKCQPSTDSDRTNAGFADFLQFSSCKGLLKIENSIFDGSHDDPINIHGTHLAVEEVTDPNTIIIAYKHPQTYGFLPCTPGDDLIVIDSKTLTEVGSPLKVKDVKTIDDYRYLVTLANELLWEVSEEIVSGYVVENLSWNPEVIIKGNIFKCTPTRAILITTRGKSLIENNTFYHTPMASILVADDANRWYESGPVKDLIIRENIFYDCSGPVIKVFPEVEEFEKPVHENIEIENNKFVNSGLPVISVSDSDNIKIKENIFEISFETDLNEIIYHRNVSHLIEQDNQFIFSSKSTSH